LHTGEQGIVGDGFAVGIDVAVCGARMEAKREQEKAGRQQVSGVELRYLKAHEKDCKTIKCDPEEKQEEAAEFRIQGSGWPVQIMIASIRVGAV
jgi:hypothetical protein